MIISFLYKRKLFFLLFYTFLYSFISFSQKIEVTGVVKDSTGNLLPNANIIASPKVKNIDISFAISNSKGQYKIVLQKETPYQIKVSYLGYQTNSFNFREGKDTTKNIILYPSSETLDEVIITERIPIVVKKDTTTYRTDIFKTGEERKLREVLKKLPGIEVDRLGNVTVNGKKVTKLLVEGKEFFTGDTKLGVNNIPADAVDEVVAIDNYSEIAFLKGLTDNEQLALNIKLKEGKKKFVFGNAEIGGGIEDRYVVHPTLFYYSPKTAVNLIGDINNTGKKSFSTKEYLDFEGGFQSLINDPTEYFKLYNDDFARFLNNDDFTFNENQFGAISLSHNFSKYLDINAYSIISKAKTETLEENMLNYLTDLSLSEERRTIEKNDLFFTINKIKLHYSSDPDNDVKYNILLKTNDGRYNQNINSVRIDSNTLINNNETPSVINLTQEAIYSQKFSSKHSTVFSIKHTYRNSNNKKDWFLSDEFFSDIIPFQPDEDINLLQNSEFKKSQISFNIDHYWKINNTNHLYGSVGFISNNQNFKTIDNQLLSNGNVNSFEDSGFNNVLDYQLNDSYIGLFYKRKIGKLILKPGVTYHNYFWNVNQFKKDLVNNSKLQLLPEMLAKVVFSNTEKLTFRYNLKSRFAEAPNYANRLRIANFNSIYRGSEALENEIYHLGSLTYSKFNLYRGLFINANINYTNKVKTIRNTTEIDGISQVNTPIYTSLPENTYAINGSVGKQINSLKFTIYGDVSISDYTRQINSTLINYSSINYGYQFKMETSFKGFPNLDIGIEHFFNDFRTTTFSNDFMQVSPYCILQYDFLNDFIFNLQYNFNYYENKNTNEINRFQIGSTSLFYNKENSPWGFEIEINNFFNTTFKNRNSFSNFLINDNNVFIQPRIFLFKLSYKF